MRRLSQRTGCLRRWRHCELLETKAMLYGEPFELMTFGRSEYFDIEASDFVYAAKVYDFNHDGVDDIVYGSGHRRSELTDEVAKIGIAIGDGEGGFELASVVNVHDDVISFQVADLNGDGWEDIVVGGVWRLSVILTETDDDGIWQGLGDPMTLGGPSSHVSLEDFDKDGILDIGSLPESYIFSTNEPPYVVVNELEVGFNVYRGLGGGEFEFSVQLPDIRRMSQYDYDNDGDIDVLERRSLRPGFVDSEVQILLHRNNSAPGEIVFGAPELTELSRLPNATLDVGHTINQDSWPDAIEMEEAYDWGSFYSRNQTMIRLGQDDGALGGPIHLVPEFFQRPIENEGWPIQRPWPMFLDTDGNGHNDFVVVEDRRIHVVLQGLQDQFATTAMNYPASRDDIYYGKLRDINGDGLLDFVGTADVTEIRGDNIDKCLVQFGQPSGEFTPDRSCIELPEEQRVLSEKYLFRYASTVWDFDNDGDQEPLRFFEDDLFLVSVEDLDQDGNLDLLYSNSPDPWNGHRDFQARYGLGNGRFQEVAHVNPTRLPVAFHGSGGVGVAVYRHVSGSEDRTGRQLETRFQLPLPNANDLLAWEGYSVHEIALRDVDGDGDEDLIVPHGSGVAVVLAIGKGDFDRDGSQDMEDLVAIRSAWQSRLAFANAPEMDLNEDGRISRDDEVFWIEEVAATAEGDIDLDGRVDFVDFLVLSSHYGDKEAVLVQGDIDGDGSVSPNDLAILRANFGLTKL